jgi:hypothetical protein
LILTVGGWVSTCLSVCLSVCRVISCFENENIVDKEPTIASQHAAMLKENFMHGADFHSGCPHYHKKASAEDREAARQIYAEGGEKVPAGLGR